MQKFTQTKRTKQVAGILGAFIITLSHSTWAEDLLIAPTPDQIAISTEQDQKIEETETPQKENASSKSATKVQTIDPRPGVVRYRWAAISIGLIQKLKVGSTFAFNLFNPMNAIGVIDHIRMISGKKRILRGHVQDHPDDHFTLTLNGASLAASIVIDGKIYSIHHVGHQPSAAHEVREISQQDFPDSKEDVTIIPIEEPASTAQAESSTAKNTEGPTIDVLILYNSGIKDPSLESLADLAVDLANQAYSDNGLSQRLRLVHKQPFPILAGYNTQSCSDILSMIQSSTTALRKKYGADLVSYMVTDPMGACGCAYLLPQLPSAKTATLGFSVTHASCIAGNYSFTHELGHNMGAMHDSCSSPQPGLFTDSHGFIDVARNIRSVMAYPYGSTIRLNRFSSTDELYQGLPLGSNASNTSTCNPEPGANNLRALLASPIGISNYFPSILPVTNMPPIAIVSNDLTAPLDSKPILLNGTASSDPEAGALAYLWQQVPTGAPTVKLATPKKAQTTFIAKKAGQYQFRLTVTDNKGAKSSDDILVTVQADPNHTLPIAIAGADRKVKTGVLVTMNGLKSIAAKGAPLTYNWIQLKNGAPLLTLTDPTTAHMNFRPVKAATYSFALVVNDGQIDSIADLINVVVKKR